jgi:CDP-glycerol glycerophosphotransferase (TagB/SpsB family)
MGEGRRMSEKMSLIERAIDEGRHITDDVQLNRQTWKEFYETSQNRRIYVMGLGAGFTYLTRTYNNSFRIYGLIDNKEEYRDMHAKAILPSCYDADVEDDTVHNSEWLDTQDKDECVVLITSTKYHVEIIKQLKAIRIKYCYVMLIMEANNKKRAEYIPEDGKQEFINKCLSKPIDGKKIVFSYGSYGGHGKEITLKLLEKRKDLDIVWLVFDMDMDVPDGVRKVYWRNWKAEVYEMETSHIWVYDQITSEYIQKRRGQVFIQVKHWSSITLKKFYLEDPAVYNNSALYERTKENVKLMDYFMVGSDFDEKSCRTGYGYNGEYVYVGSPRTDIMFRDVKKKVCDFYNLNIDANLILYAPTYRETNVVDENSVQFELDFEAVKEACAKRFGGDWVILLRLHPSSAAKMKGRFTDGNVISATDYYDCQELASAAEITISDFSSIMFEPAFVLKPVFLYAPDRENYIGNEKYLLINYNSLPFPIAESNEEMVENIINFDVEQYRSNVRDFLDENGVHEDGHASERAAEFISGLIDKE